MVCPGAEGGTGNVGGGLGLRETDTGEKGERSGGRFGRARGIEKSVAGRGIGMRGVKEGGRGVTGIEGKDLFW